MVDFEEILVFKVEIFTGS